MTQLLAGQLEDLVDEARALGEDAARCVALARRWDRAVPIPGEGRTWQRWETLCALGAAELTAARVLEAHWDAVAILHEAGLDELGAGLAWGVFAAEAPGCEVRLSADRTHISGTKAWCSLGGSLDAALVTVHDGSARRLVSVDLRHSGVAAAGADGWVARGLRQVVSAPVQFTDVPVSLVGGVGWYLERPGFAWGGMGVAACWLGGAQAIAETLVQWASRRGGDLASLAVGRVDAALHAAEQTLRSAAATVDSGDAGGQAGAVLALRVRAVVADAVEVTLREAAHAMGPAPLAFDETHARRVADLELYVRQHHADRDLAALGAARLDAHPS